MLNKTIDKSKYVEIIKAKNVIIQTEGKNHVHIDGEPVVMKDKIEIKLLPRSLNIIYKPWIILNSVLLLRAFPCSVLLSDLGIVEPKPL